MGVFTIRSRSASLGNLSNPGVRQVRTPQHHTGSGSQNQWRAVEGLGRDIMHAGQIAAGVAADMMRRRRMIEEAEAEAEFERGIRERMEGEGGILTRATSARDAATLTGTVDEANALFKSSAADFLDEKGYKGDERRRMMLRLGTVTAPYERAMSRTVVQKSKAFEVSSADAVFGEKQQTWQSNSTDVELTKNVIDAYRASQVVRGLDDATVDANTDAVVRGMAYDMIARDVAAADREQLDRLESLAREGDGAELLWSNEALAEYFGDKDPLAHTTGKRGAGTVTAKDGILASIAARRRELDRLDNEAVENVVNEGIQAASVIRDENGNYPADRLARIEESIVEAKRLSETMPKGSAAAANAASGAAKLDAVADSVAGEELMLELVQNAIDNPKNPKRIWVSEERDENGKITREGHAADGIANNPRKVRLAKTVQAQFDASTAPVATAQRKENVAKLKLEQFNGAQNRGEYHKKLFDAAMAGDITLNEWHGLVSEFDETWATGGDGRISQKQVFAQNALSAIQEVFGDEVTSAFSYDPKSGNLKKRKDSSYSGLSFEVADRYGFWNWRNWIGQGEIEWTTTHRLTAEDVGELASWGAELARYDGEKMEKDPITGSREKDYFGEKWNPDVPFDAATYFRKYVTKMRRDKYVEENVDYVQKLADAVVGLQNEDYQRLKDEAKKIDEAAQPQNRKQAVIKKPNTKAVGVADKR